MLLENSPTIETPRLRLRKFKKEEAAALFAFLSQEDSNCFLPWFPLKTLAEGAEFLQTHFLDYYVLPSAYRYALCLKDCDMPIGYVWLSGGESHDFGYALKKEYWHKGYATEAARAVMEKIKDAGYGYITATHDKNNPRSGEVMKKLGLRYAYSYVEQWQPKNISVTFRMYQLNFDGGNQIYQGYWEQYQTGFIEEST